MHWPPSGQVRTPLVAWIKEKNQQNLYSVSNGQNHLADQQFAFSVHEWTHSGNAYRHLHTKHGETTGTETAGGREGGRDGKSKVGEEYKERQKSI